MCERVRRKRVYVGFTHLKAESYHSWHGSQFLKTYKVARMGSQYGPLLPDEEMPWGVPRLGGGELRHRSSLRSAGEFMAEARFEPETS